nr:uncharacterized protein LOC113816619 [Penaeus vannamei]
MELLKLETDHLVIISAYKPSNAEFRWPSDFDVSCKSHLVIGEFNSHSTQWGYNEDNQNGENAIMWAINNDLTLLYESKDPPTFSSARWKRGYNPDLVLISNNRRQVFQRNVLDHIPRSQHRHVEV